MTWSVTASGDVPADKQASFSSDVVALFKKYGADVHAFFFQHPGGTVQTQDLTSSATTGAGASESSDGVAATTQSTTPVSEAAPTQAAVPATGGKTEQAHAGAGNESLPPTGPTIDLANVATATTPASETVTVTAPAATDRVAKVEAEVVSIKNDLAAILAAVQK